MPKTHRPVAFVAVLLGLTLATFGVAPASAGALTPAERARRAAKLDPATASDGELSSAVGVVTSQVMTQIKRVNAAKRSAAQAEGALAEATAELKATEDEIGGLRGSIVAKAVDTYMRPQRNQPAFHTQDLAEVSRRRALLTHVERREGDVLDELHSVQQDLAIREAVAGRARDAAAGRRRDATAQLSTLARGLKDKDRLSAALEARIRDAESEDLERLASEGPLTELLKSNDFSGAVSKSGLAWPLKGRITSGFGRRWGRLHAGIDIAAPRGTPIHAARAGKVVFSGWMGGYGNAVVISHGGGFATLYGHQSRRAVKVGETVKQGEVIGYVGSTGHSTGNHLHFETRVNGTAVNPRRYLP
ncbi:MAG TPA: peptidoglycan DD-metalloendopeptidase family protein [Acidimicrobiales bacterium]|nr:peptidoglycan DD-metalloendopeptidase family protein [Acidimicrobiales bacterium]